MPIDQDGYWIDDPAGMMSDDGAVGADFAPPAADFADVRTVDGPGEGDAMYPTQSQGAVPHIAPPAADFADVRMLPPVQLDRRGRPIDSVPPPEAQGGSVPGMGGDGMVQTGAGGGHSDSYSTSASSTAVNRPFFQELEGKGHAAYNQTMKSATDTAAAGIQAAADRAGALSPEAAQAAFGETGNFGSGAAGIMAQDQDLLLRQEQADNEAKLEYQAELAKIAADQKAAADRAAIMLEQKRTQLEQHIQAVRQMTINPRAVIDGMSGSGRALSSAAVMAQAFLGMQGVKIDVTGQMNSWIERDIDAQRESIKTGQWAVEEDRQLYEYARAQTDTDAQALTLFSASRREQAAATLQMVGAQFSGERAASAVRSGYTTLKNQQSKETQSILEDLNAQNAAAIKEETRSREAAAQRALESRRISIAQAAAAQAQENWKTEHQDKLDAAAGVAKTAEAEAAKLRPGIYRTVVDPETGAKTRVRSFTLDAGSMSPTELAKARETAQISEDVIGLVAEFKQANQTARYDGPGGALLSADATVLAAAGARLASALARENSIGANQTKQELERVMATIPKLTLTRNAFVGQAGINRTLDTLSNSINARTAASLGQSSLAISAADRAADEANPRAVADVDPEQTALAYDGSHPKTEVVSEAAKLSAAITRNDPKDVGNIGSASLPGLTYDFYRERGAAIGKVMPDYMVRDSLTPQPKWMLPANQLFADAQSKDAETREEALSQIANTMASPTATPEQVQYMDFMQDKLQAGRLSVDDWGGKLSYIDEKGK